MLHLLVVGQVGNYWKKINIEVKNLKTSYYLFWNATRGFGDTGDIAVDEISVCPGKC